MSLLVYSLTPHSSHRISATGITGERLRRIRVGAIDAIVSSPRSAPAPSERNLQRYVRTVAALSRQVTALLPVRFGTIVGDEAELEQMLESRQALLRRRLRDVRNRSQMTVRVVVSSPPSLPLNSAGASARLARAETGADYLRGRARATREVPGFEPVRNAVKRWVKSELIEKRAGVASVYHLVPSGSVTRYRRALEAAARDAHLRVVVTGPWPPYAFAQEDL